MTIAILIDDILLSPCKLVHWIGSRLYEHAEAEVTDELAIRRDLLELQVLFETDEISAEERDRQEAILMQRLNAIREYKQSRTLD